MADGGPGRIGFTPRVPDGPDRPWTRGRRTRWWLVVPADLAVVGATSLFASAAVHDASRAPGLAAGGAADGRDEDGGNEDERERGRKG